MTQDARADVRAVPRQEADQMVSPPAGLSAIRRGGRHRRILAVGAGGLIPVVLAACAVAGGARAPGNSHRASPGDTGPAASSTGQPRPSPTAHQRLPAAVSRVRAFYLRYQAAASRGSRAADVLIRARVANWYAPVLEARTGGGLGAPDCGAPALSPRVRFGSAGRGGGQDVVVAWWISPAGQRSSIVVTLLPRTGKITGITCTAGTGSVTATGAAEAASALYGSYLRERANGASATTALTRLTSGGPASGSPYLRQVLTASASHPLGYDPLLCGSKPGTTVTTGHARIIAAGSAGLVTVRPRDGSPVLAVVMLGAKGWTLADIACQSP